MEKIEQKMKKSLDPITQWSFQIRVSGTRYPKIAKKNSCEIAFWAVLNFNSRFKYWFLAILEIVKNGIWPKFFRELDLFDVTSFLARTFLNFLAHCALVRVSTPFMSPDNEFCAKSAKSIPVAS